MVFATLKIHVFILTVVAYQCWGCHCPKGFEPYGSSCYHFSHDVEDFGVADMMCHHMGGVLAKIECSAENEFITSKLKQIGANAWIGLTDILVKAQWAWYDGMVPLSYYSNWKPGEPNYLGEEACVEIRCQDGKWNNIPCDSKRNYVCKKKNGCQKRKMSPYLETRNNSSNAELQFYKTYTKLWLRK